MGFDAFISHSSKDKTAADAATAVLESHGIRCWIAPRDITPGEDWSEAILKGIGGSRVLVLLFSANANDSPQIKREVERAVNRGIPIIPMRLEDVMPQKALEYFISTPHWLDAFNPPFEEHLETLARTVKRLLDDDDTPAGDGAARPAPVRAALPWYRLHAKPLAVSAAVVIGLFLLAVIAFSGDPDPLPAPPFDPGPGTVDNGNGTSREALAAKGTAAFVGRWKLLNAKMDPEPIIPGPPMAMIVMPNSVVAAFASPDASGEMTIDEHGSFVIQLNSVTDGRYTADMKPDRLGKHFHAHGMMTLMPNGSPASDRVQARLAPTDRDMPHVFASKGDVRLMLQPFRNDAATVTWARPGGGDPTRVVGSYNAGGLYLDSYIPYTGTLTLAANGSFTVRFARAEKGVFTAEKGKFTFTRSVAAGPPGVGSYAFDGPDRVTFIEPRGTAVWERVK